MDTATATATFHMIYLCTSNDVSGNPRRAWFLLNDIGVPTEVYEEGFTGCNVVPAKYRDARLATPRINVGVQEYSSWLKAVL